MRPALLFLVIVLAAVAALAVLVAWYVGGYQGGGGSVSGMMGQMMGTQYTGGMMTPMPWYVWWVFAALLVFVVGGVVGVAYYTALPPIKTVGVAQVAQPLQRAPVESPKQDWDVLMRTSKPDEKRVLEVLAAHDGTYLQKFIVKETGLSRLKTHRILSRFAERGVVTAVPSGNTNEISLAGWLTQKTTAE